MTTITCASCHHEVDQNLAIAVAGPGGAHWYCRDGDACRERRS